MEAQKRKSYANYRNSRRPAPKRTGDVRETILLQCIVSGTILLFTLGINFINLPGAQTLRQNLKQAISGETTVESLQGLMSGVTDKVTGVKESVKDLFDEDIAEPESELDRESVTPISQDSSWQTETIQNDVVADEPLETKIETRIDEDILERIQREQSEFSTGKKSEAPLS